MVQQYGMVLGDVSIIFLKKMLPSPHHFLLYLILFVFLLDSSWEGHTINITKINRVHMGEYRCIADNGIPPSANQTFYIEVHCK